MSRPGGLLGAWAKPKPAASFQATPPPSKRGAPPSKSNGTHRGKNSYAPSSSSSSAPSSSSSQSAAASKQQQQPASKAVPFSVPDFTPVTAESVPQGRVVGLPTSVLPVDLPGDSLKGVVKCYDSNYHCLLVEAPSVNNVAYGFVGTQRDYWMVNSQTCPVTPSETSMDIDLRVPQPNVQQCQDRLQKAVDLRKGDRAKVGKGVSPLAQWLFDCFDKQFNCTWDGAVIVVENSTRISPPYRPANCTGGKKAVQDHMKNLLEHHLNSKNLPAELRQSS